MRAVFVLLVSLAVSLSYPQARALERESVTPFETGPQGGIVLQVRLNGRGPFRFLLDTGSTHTAISQKTAADIGAPIVAKTALGSVAGSREAAVVRIDRLEAGPITAPHLLASIVRLDGIGGVGRVDGVIGHDALARFRYTIDFRQRRLLWWPTDAALARGTALRLQSSHGRFLLSLPQGRSVLRLVPDTGAESLLLFEPDHTLPLTHLLDRATMKTMSGEAEVRLARVRELHVGAVILRDVPAVVTERDRSEPPEVDGLLPLHFFDRVTVDGPQGLLIVEKTSG